MKQTEKFCDEIKSSRLPAFIWGTGKMSRLVCSRLAIENIKAEGYVVDDEYMSNANVGGVMSASYLRKNYKKYNIVCGFTGALYMSLQELTAHWPEAEGVYVFPDIFEPDIVEPISEDFFQENKKKFDEVKDALYDDFSKKIMEAFLHEKVSGDYRLILPYVVRPQYFFKNTLWKYNDHEIFLDCGAYDGDSISNFIDLVGSYDSIIACEPDKTNYNKLVSNIEKNNWKRIKPYQIGISDEAGTVMFYATGDMLAAIDKAGDEQINIDTIDHLLNGAQVSIIKMDIEGFEMPGLRGAEKTIREYRPMLMISAYHKKDDIYNIFQFIRSIVKGYRYYFRCHEPYTVDGVLYAVPEERVI